MDGALLNSIATLGSEDVEGEEVAVAGNGVQLVADGYRFTSDDCLPWRPPFEPHHGLIEGELTWWGEVVREDGEAVVVQRFYLLNHGVSDTCRGGLCDVEVAEELREAIA